MKHLLSLSLVLLLASSLSGQKLEGKQKDLDIILKNIDLFSQYYMQGDIESLVNCYTEDAKIFPGRMDIQGGSEALAAFWEMPADMTVLHHKINPEEIKVIKDTAYDWGYYEGKTQVGGGEVSPFKGKYVIVWKKVNKDWKIYLDIWNRISD